MMAKALYLTKGELEILIEELRGMAREEKIGLDNAFELLLGEYDVECMVAWYEGKLYEFWDSADFLSFLRAEGFLWEEEEEKYFKK